MAETLRENKTKDKQRILFMKYIIIKYDRYIQLFYFMFIFNKSLEEKIQLLREKFLSQEFEAVIHSAKKLLNTNPGSYEIHNIIGAVYMAQKEFHKAEIEYKKVTDLAPSFANGFNNLGLSLMKQSRTRDSINCFKKTIKLDIENFDGYFNLGVAYSALEQFENALRYCNIALSLKPNDYRVIVNIANIRKKQNSFQEAYENYKKASLIEPKLDLIHFNMGLTLKLMGNINEAEKEFTIAIGLNPSNGEYYRALSLVKDFSEDKDIECLTTMKKFFDSLKDSDQKCRLAFAISKFYDDIGQIDNTFNYLSIGNRLRKKDLSYNIESDKKYFQQIKTADKKISSVSFTNESQDSFKPIFILGMPRSGSSLIEQIITCHSEVCGLGELNSIKNYGKELIINPEKINKSTIKDFRDRYFKEIASKGLEKTIFTDKMPNNFMYIGLIIAAFPESKILHVSRQPEAVCWSNFKHFFPVNGLGYSYDLSDTVDYYNLYYELMCYWNRKYKNRIYNVNYDSLTINQENEIRKMIKYLDLNWEDKCLSPHLNERVVFTASGQQVKEEIYTGSSEAWKKYSQFLHPYFKNLVEMAGII